MPVNVYFARVLLYFTKLIAAFRRLLVLWLLLSGGDPVRAQPVHPLVFSTLTTADSLSDNSVYSLLQDRRGVLWLGSQDGLNRYDGAGTRVFRHEPRRLSSLSRNWVTSLVEDQAGHIWVGTGGSGLCRYDPLTDRFQRLRAGTAPTSLANDFIRALLRDRAGRVWVATDDGLHVWVSPGGFRRFQHAPGVGGLERSNTIRALTQSADGTLWVGTGAGYVSHVDERSGLLVPDPRWRLTSSITALCPAPAGGLWVGTETDGLLLLDSGNHPIRSFRADSTRSGQLASNWVRALFCDRQQQLWVGTSGGLAQYQPRSGTFYTYRHQPAQPHSLPDNGVRTISQDRTGRLWVGTDNGVSSFDSQPAPFRSVPLGSNAWGIVEDREGRVWVGTEHGLLHYDPANGRKRYFHHASGDTSSLAEDNVSVLLLARTGQLWVGTRTKGLDCLLPGSSRFRHYRHRPAQPNSLCDDLIRCLSEDAQGRIWVGTESGLSCPAPRLRPLAYLPPRPGRRR